MTSTTTSTTTAPRTRAPRKIDLADAAPVTAPEPKRKSKRFAKLDIDVVADVVPVADEIAAFEATPIVEVEPVVEAAPELQTFEQREARIVEDRLAAEAAGFKVAKTVYTEGQSVIDLGIENAVKSRQAWEALPTVGRAADALMIQIASETRRDVIIPATEVAMKDDGTLSHDLLEGRAPIADPAFRDLCSLGGYGFGATYLLKNCDGALRAENVNRQARGASPESKVCLRTRQEERGHGREVFAAVSDSYTAVDIDTIVPLLLAAMPDDARADVTYQRAEARGVIDVLFHSSVRAEDYACGEMFKAGIRVKWDDAGHGAIKVDALIWRNLCLNLIIVDTAVVNVGKVIHIGALEKKTDQLRQAFAKANDALGHFVKAWGFAKKEIVEPKPIALKKSKVLKAENQPTAKPWEACSVDERVEGLVNGMVLVGQLPTLAKADVAGIVTSYWKDEVTGTKDITRAGVVNAVSRWAHQGMDRWSGDALERAAGLMTWATNEAMPFQYAYVQQAA